MNYLAFSWESVAEVWEKFKEIMNTEYFYLRLWMWIAIAAVVVVLAIIIGVTVGRKKSKAKKARAKAGGVNAPVEEEVPVSVPENVPEAEKEPEPEAEETKPAESEENQTEKQTGKEEEGGAGVKKSTATVKSSATKTRAKVYHVTKRTSDGRWQVKLNKGAKASRVFVTQAEAIEYAKKLAHSQHASIMIHKEDGSFRRLRYNG